MNDLTAYRAARDAMRPGDVIAFGGEGFVSGAIKFLTRSQVSHVGVVFGNPDSMVVIAESTSLNGRSGVQFNRLSERIEEYPGRAWWLPLSDHARAALDADEMRHFLLAQDGKSYDFRGINAFLARPIPGWGQIPFFHHGAEEAWFCSEYVAAGFQQAGLLHGHEPDEVSPQKLCEMSIYDKCVQLIGKPQEIGRFNTL